MKHKNNGLIDSDCFMTRRDQVAAMALQGILADDWRTSAIEIAEWAVEYADALLLELDKKNPGKGQG